MLCRRFAQWSLRQYTVSVTEPWASGLKYSNSSDDKDDDIPSYEKSDVSNVVIVRKKGLDVITDGLYNKGTGFPDSERERLGIRGLVPPRILSLEDQKQKILEDYYDSLGYVPPEQLDEWGVSSEHVRRWRVLQALQDRNETLFYNLLTSNIKEMAPIIYTPVVGWVCMNYHMLMQKPRGLFISKNQKGEIASVVWNWPCSEVDAIVITDGSRILGLGDLGLNGMGICVGKLDLYVAAGGFHPTRVLPIAVDVGTDNEQLLQNNVYMGVPERRLRGREYYEIMDEVITALTQRYPSAVVQFEDFSMNHAKPLLERYRHDHLVFNDDIQGTACSALAGLYGAMSVQGLPNSAITDQRIVVLGAGSAGMGVCALVIQAMMKHGLSKAEAGARFWVVDVNGLVTSNREHLEPWVRDFARKDAESKDGDSLLDVIKRVKPTGADGPLPSFDTTRDFLSVPSLDISNSRFLESSNSAPRYRKDTVSTRDQRS